MDIWNAFRNEVHVLESEISLIALSAMAEKDEPAFWELMRIVHDRVVSWWQSLAIELTPDLTYYHQHSVIESYERVQGAVLKERNTLLEQSITALNPYEGKRLLELGAGAGYASKRMISRGASVWASDGSQEMLDHHLRSMQESGIQVLSNALDGDLSLESWKNLETYGISEGFDGVLMFMAMHLVHDRLRAYQGIHGLLKSGGTMVIVHDHLAHPDQQWRFSSQQSVLDGYNRLLETGKRVSLIRLIAGLMFRRRILHNERMMTLEEELDIIKCVFPAVLVRKLTNHDEWSIIIAQTNPDPT